MTRRIGPKMQMAAEYVARHPGCTKADAARAVGPHGSLKFGYEVVDRAQRAGLIRYGVGEECAHLRNRNHYALYVVEP